MFILTSLNTGKKLAINWVLCTLPVVRWFDPLTKLVSDADCLF